MRAGNRDDHPVHPRILFKLHARRRAPAAGLTIDEIEGAIVEHLRIDPPVPGDPFHRVITVSGKPMKYTGIWRTETNVIEVGTYYWWQRRGRG